MWLVKCKRRKTPARKRKEDLASPTFRPESVKVDRKCLSLVWRRWERYVFTVPSQLS